MNAMRSNKHSLPGSRSDVSPKHAKWLLALIVLVALGARLWGVEAGLPVIYHPDEPDYSRIAQRIFKTGDLNPHTFNYPSVFFYLNALAYVPFYVGGKVFGVYESRGDIAEPVSFLQGITVTSQPNAILMERLLTVAFGVGVVLLVYVVGRSLLNSRLAGLIGAFLMAVSVTNVTYSRWITPDTFLVFFILFAFWGAVQVYKHGELRHYLLAGVGLGLVGGTKYNGVLIVVTLIAAHFMRRGLRGVVDPRLYLAGLASVVTFLVTTPFAIFDYPRFIADLRFEAQHYSTGHLGMEGETLEFYLAHFRNYEGLVVLLALLEAGRGLVTRNKPLILLSVFPLLYFLFIIQFVVRNDRTLLPMLPFVYLLGGHFLVNAAGVASRDGAVGEGRRRVHRGAVAAARWVALCGVAVLALLTIVVPMERMAVSTTYRLDGINSRSEAMRWIEGNVPPGSRIAIEAYSPYVDPQRYSVTGVTRIAEHPAEWYIENGQDYLVFSKFTFRRTLNARDRFPEEARRYDEMFAMFEQVKVFPHGDYEILIYRVPKS